MKALEGHKTYIAAAGSILTAVVIWSFHIWGVSAFGVSAETVEQLPSVGDATLLFWGGLSLIGIRSAMGELSNRSR